MSFYEKCRSYSVIVGNGSGVLFQPMTDEYTYVLTAKHNIENSDAQDIQIKRYDDTPLTAQEKYLHNEKDIAIIKINKLETFDGPLKKLELPNDGERYKLYGYPNSRRINTTDEKIHNLDFDVTDINDDTIQARNIDYSGQVEVNGFSGGGLFQEIGEDVYCLGIESRMDSDTVVETHERVRVIFIKVFDEIVEANGELAPLLPAYMNNFMLLQEEIFSLRGMPFKQELAQRFFRNIAYQSFAGLTPQLIKQEFGTQLLIIGQKKSLLLNDILWKLYLEFLVICTLLDSNAPSTITDIKEIYKKRKYLFADSHDWTSLTEPILRSDLSEVQKGGIIVIGSSDREPTRCDISQRILTNNARVFPSEMKISEAISEPFKELKFIHIHLIQKTLIEDEHIFIDANITNIEEKIKDELAKIFN